MSREALMSPANKSPTPSQPPTIYPRLDARMATKLTINWDRSLTYGSVTGTILPYYYVSLVEQFQHTNCPGAAPV